MYKCNKCGETFDKPVHVLENERHTEIAEAGHVPAEVLARLTCPECGGDDIIEGDTCKSCGDFTDGVLCAECSKFLEQALDEVRKALNITTEQFEDAIYEHFGW